MPTVTIKDAAVVSYGQQLITLRPGDIVHGDLAEFLLHTSGVPVTKTDDAPEDEPTARPRRGRPPKTA